MSEKTGLENLPFLWGICASLTGGLTELDRDGNPASRALTEFGIGSLISGVLFSQTDRNPPAKALLQRLGIEAAALTLGGLMMVKGEVLNELYTKGVAATVFGGAAVPLMNDLVTLCSRAVKWAKPNLTASS